MAEPGESPQTLVIGRIVGVHGVRGWVRVHSYTEPEENLLGYANLKLGREPQWQAIEFDAGRRHGKRLIAHIAGIDDRNAAEGLQGMDIVMAAASLPSLAEGEFYWHQLPGFEVYAAGQLLGCVARLIATGANDVFVVRPCEGSIDERERLIPWIKGDVVKSVDITGAAIEVDWDVEF